MVVSYRASFTDPSYNPLPRAVWIGDNRYGRNGFAPAFEGGKELAAAVGGTLPNIMWDGVVSFTVPGGKPVTDNNSLYTRSTVLNLQLKQQGTPVSAAQPRMDQIVFTDGPPKVTPIALPAAQLARAALR